MNLKEFQRNFNKKCTRRLKIYGFFIDFNIFFIYLPCKYIKMLSAKEKDRAYNILSEYQGRNYYILTLRRNVYILKQVSLNDFEAEYIIKNYDKETVQVNKVVKISDWYSKTIRENKKLDFSPEKIKIISLIGETDKIFHCLVQYKQSIPAEFMFIPKQAILNDFLSEEYKDLKLDFTWFDKKLKQKNSDFYVFDYQKEAVKFLLTRKKCVLSLDMGLGKTYTSIMASLMYGNKKVLVICPASMKEQWKSDLCDFVDESQISLIKGFNEMNKPELMEFLGITDSKLYKVNELRDIAKDRGKWNEGKQFTILNFDILDEFHTISRARNNENSELLKSDFDIVIIDEAHKLSNNKSGRFKTVKNYLSHAKNEYTWLLTGTMVTNDVKNLYNMLSLIEKNVTADYNFFMERYCGAKKILRKGEWDRCWNMWNKGRYSSYSVMDKKSKDSFKEFVERVGKHVVKTDENINLNELNERIKHLYFRRIKDDVMSVSKIIVPVTYNLNDIQKREYAKLWDDYEKEKLAEGKDLSEVKQLVSVFVNRQYISKIMVPNTISLTEKLLSHDKKVFIVCAYDEELYKLKEYFGDKAVIYNGKMDSKQKEKSKIEFNENPDIKILIGNIDAVGVGLNLQKACHHVIFQNMDFTDAGFSQACDRLYRIGQKNDVYVYLQYYKNTVYEHMVDIITRKREISEQVINDK